MFFILKIIVMSALVISSNVNASVLNTLNGIDYEWLELTETAGLSRTQVELRLADTNDVLYGYEYASRSLVEDLYMSYSSFDGFSGRHGDPDVISGGVAFLNDFGHTIEQDNYGGYITVEGTFLDFTTEPGLSVGVYGIYGQEGECKGLIGTSYSCATYWEVYTDPNRTPLYSWQSSTQGWDATSAIVTTRTYSSMNRDTGSLLVRSVSPVPIPAAAWLCGSGLIGLTGFARRKKLR